MRGRRRTGHAPRRDALIGAVGREVAAFQDSSSLFDDAAAAALVIDRADLPLMSALLFQGGLSREQLAGILARPAGGLRATLARLELAGYVRRIPGSRDVELTELARAWIETIWGPLQQEGTRMLEAFSDDELARMARFLELARDVQARHAARVRAQLDRPRARNRRGGLSPAALRRVELFVEAHLDRPIRLEELAERAGVSKFHFARAFRASTGMTPRAFTEHRRIERAKRLLRASTSTLSAIALATGFGTQSRFTTVFGRATGMTPAAFRRLER